VSCRRPAPEQPSFWILPREGLVLLGGFLLVAVWGTEARAMKLEQATAQAWERYFRWADEKVSRELTDPNRFLIEDYLPPAEKESVRRQLASGAVFVARARSAIPSGVDFEVADGEIHHWWGAVLVPGVRMPELMRFLQDYDHHAGIFPEVEQSRLISHEGNRYRFFFRLKRSRSFVTACYNTEQECVYSNHGRGRMSSRSIATRIAELDSPGTPAEQERPPGDDRGILWRLVTWWRFQQTGDGVIVELESASLSRSIPLIVKFIPGLAAYIKATPKESLESVLLSVRAHFKPGH
jgi:hypothetical protein